MPIEIDPNTGERINSPEIDPATGERVTTQARPVTPPASAPKTPQAPVTPEPQVQDRSFFDRAKEWATAPINVGHLREKLASDQERYTSPTLADVDFAQKHPVLNDAKELLSEYPKQLRIQAAKMFLSPVGLATSMLGGVGETGALLGRGTWALAPVARMLGAGARAAEMGIGAGFVGTSVKDIVSNPLPKDGEDATDYAARMAGNVAGLIGGVGLAKGMHELGKNAAAPTIDPNVIKPAPKVPAGAAERAAARKAQAVAFAKGPQSQTIHVDPQFADHFNEWSKADLPNKRVIVRTTKAGNRTVRLAHSDPEEPGFGYTNPPEGVSNKVVDDDSPGAVPITLSPIKGARGTSTPGHFLDWQLGTEMPAPGPKTALPATPAASTVVPQPETPAKAPAASQTPQQRSAQILQQLVARSKPQVVEPTEVPPTPAQDLVQKVTGKPSEPVTPPAPVTQPKEGLRPGGLPEDIKGSKPRYSYGTKQFQLEFEDPHDLAAYTMAQGKANKAQARFSDYLKTQYPSLKDEDFAAHGAQIRAAIKEQAKTANPSDGPLQVPSQGGIKAKTPQEVAAPITGRPVVDAVRVQPEAPKTPPAPEPVAAPAKDLTPQENNVRKLVGQAMQIGRLLKGKEISEPIDDAIRISQESGGVLPEDLAKKMEEHLGEEVGNVLSDEQIAKLEHMRGGTLSDARKITYLDKGETESRLAGPYGEELEAKLARWQDQMLQDLANPGTPQEVKDAINQAFEPDSQGNAKYVQYERKMEYPKPEELAADHPEKPFVDKAFGHSILRDTLENRAAAGLGNYKSKFLVTGKGTTKYLSPGDLAQLEDVRARSEQGPSEESPFEGIGGSFDEDSDFMDTRKAQLMEILGSPEEGTQRGRVFQPKLKPDVDTMTVKRDLATKALKNKFNEVQQDLATVANQWNKARGQAVTPLLGELSRLSEEARSYLPQELFNYEKPPSAKAPETSATSETGKPVEAPAKTAKATTTVRPGSQTETEGIKYTKWDSALKKANPDMYKHASLLRQAIVDKNIAPQARQELYARVMQTYHDAVVGKDPFALKQAIDVIVRPGEAGYITLGSGGLYTPEQIHFMNATTADAFLQRWEAMSPSELAKRKTGLWKDSLVHRIEGAVPTAEDPEIREAQAELYHELKARHEALKEAVGGSHKLWDNVMDFIDRGPERAKLKQVFREVQGYERQNEAIRRTALDKYDQLFGQLPLAEQDRAVDAITRGAPLEDNLFDAVSPEYLSKWKAEHGEVDPNGFAKIVRDTLDGARERYTSASGNLKEFLVNYMPGLYENQAKATKMGSDWTARRPLAGNSDFLKQKIYEFHQDALNAGLQPVTSNPVRMAMMIADRLDRATMAHEFKNRLIDEGIVDWYSKDETPPEGHVALNDRIFGDGGLGSYFAPSHVARAFNNFVSTGLTGKWRVPYTDFSLYDALKNTNSTANQFQLGLSLFHGMETIANSAFGTMGLGLKQIVNEGKLVQGAKNIGKGASFLYSAGEDAWNGHRGLVTFRDPEKALQYGEDAHRFLQLSDDLRVANANVKTDPRFKLEQVERFKEAWAHATDDFQGNGTRAVAVAKAAKNALGAAVEATAWPLMEGFIPRVKVGAFMRMAEQIHSEYAGAKPDVINQEIQKAWDSIDNRFGQVNYDNMFLNRTTKDLMHLLVRSPGWNLGTFREVGGGVIDLGKSLGVAASGGGFKITNRTAYTGALVAGTMLGNALLQYMHTGQVAQGIDYFFPKDGTKSSTGEDNRIYPKDYVYDFINLYHDPIKTVWHKAAPDVSTIADLIQNEDYYHHQIRDPGNSVTANAASVLAYLAHQFVPFSFGNLSEAKLRGDSSNVESFAGILPAPRWVGRTNAENLAFDYFQGLQSKGAEDEVTWERRRDFVQLRNKIARGEVTADQVQDAVNSGKITPKMVRYLYDTKTDPNTGQPLQPQLITWTKRLDSEQQLWNVWKAASVPEKKLLLPVIVPKLIQTSGGPKLESYMDEIQKFQTEHPD